MQTKQQQVGLFSSGATKGWKRLSCDGSPELGVSSWGSCSKSTRAAGSGRERARRCRHPGLHSRDCRCCCHLPDVTELTSSRPLCHPLQWFTADSSFADASALVNISSKIGDTPLHKVPGCPMAVTNCNKYPTLTLIYLWLTNAGYDLPGQRWQSHPVRSSAATASLSMQCPGYQQGVVTNVVDGCVRVRSVFLRRMDAYMLQWECIDGLIVRTQSTRAPPARIRATLCANMSVLSSKMGDTALHQAARRNHVNVVRLLLIASASLRTCNKWESSS